MNFKRSDFPDGFVFGAATSSYQIEGAWDLHGKGESIWDRFSSTPEKIEDGTTGQDACDHYVRWRDDIEYVRLYRIQHLSDVVEDRRDVEISRDRFSTGACAVGGGDKFHALHALPGFVLKA